MNDTLSSHSCDGSLSVAGVCGVARIRDRSDLLRIASVVAGANLAVKIWWDDDRSGSATQRFVQNVRP